MSEAHLRNLELATCTDRNVVEVLHTPFDGHRVAHLHHGGALFGFQEFYLRIGARTSFRLQLVASPLRKLLFWTYARTHPRHVAVQTD